MFTVLAAQLPEAVVEAVETADEGTSVSLGVVILGSAGAAADTAVNG